MWSKGFNSSAVIGSYRHVITYPSVSAPIRDNELGHLVMNIFNELSDGALENIKREQSFGK